GCVDDIARLTADRQRPRQAFVGREVDPALRRGVSEESPEQPTRGIRLQSVTVPVSLEGETHGPCSSVVRAAPQPDRRRPSGEDLVSRKYATPFSSAKLRGVSVR